MLCAGIVGLPNVGKSTLFNAVTQSQKAMAANPSEAAYHNNLGNVYADMGKYPEAAADCGASGFLHFWRARVVVNELPYLIKV